MIQIIGSFFFGIIIGVLISKKSNNELKADYIVLPDGSILS